MICIQMCPKYTSNMDWGINKMQMDQIAYWFLSCVGPVKGVIKASTFSCLSLLSDLGGLTDRPICCLQKSKESANKLIVWRYCFGKEG